jgi:hypothetical protein
MGGLTMFQVAIPDWAEHDFASHIGFPRWPKGMAIDDR